MILSTAGQQVNLIEISTELPVAASLHTLMAVVGIGFSLAFVYMPVSLLAQYFTPAVMYIEYWRWRRHTGCDFPWSALVH